MLICLSEQIVHMLCPHESVKAVASILDPICASHQLRFSEAQICEDDNNIEELQGVRRNLHHFCLSLELQGFHKI